MQVLPPVQVVPSQHAAPVTPQQKPRLSQVGSVRHMDTDTHDGRHTGTPEVSALRSHTYALRQPPGDWPAWLHCARHTFTGVPAGLKPHWLPARQSVDVVHDFVQ
jgi:hypothetical protein